MNTELIEIEESITKYNDIIKNNASNNVLKKYGMYEFGTPAWSVINTAKTQLYSLTKRRTAVLKGIKDQEIASQKSEADRLQAISEKAKADLERAKADVEKSKSESLEAQAKAQIELAKAKITQELADEDTMYAKKTLLGMEAINYKPFIIGGVVVGLGIIGVVIYRIVKK